MDCSAGEAPPNNGRACILRESPGGGRTCILLEGVFGQLADMPEELLLISLNMLQLDEFGTAAQTCHRLRDAANDRRKDQLISKVFWDGGSERHRTMARRAVGIPPSVGDISDQAEFERLARISPWAFESVDKMRDEAQRALQDYVRKRNSWRTTVAVLQYEVANKTSYEVAAWIQGHLSEVRQVLARAREATEALSRANSSELLLLKGMPSMGIAGNMAEDEAIKRWQAFCKRSLLVA